MLRIESVPFSVGRGVGRVNLDWGLKDHRATKDQLQLRFCNKLCIFSCTCRIGARPEGPGMLLQLP